MELNYNIFNIIIISGVIYGLVFGLIVTSQKKYITNNTKYLAFIVLCLSLSNFQYWLLDTGLIHKYQIIKYIYIPWHWLVLPMFYLYVRKFIGREKISKKFKTFLLFPFCFILVIHIALIIYNLLWDSSYEIPSHFKRGIFVYLEFLSVVFNVAIMYLAFRIIKTHERSINYEVKWVKSETNWLKNLIYTGLIICFCWLIAITSVVIYNLNQSYIFYPMWIGISFLVYWIGHVGLTKSQLLQERIKIRQKRVEAINDNVDASIGSSDTFDKIEILIIDKKTYLNPNLSIAYISNELKVSEGYVSQLISKNSKLNFNDYINKLRIIEAEKILKDDSFDNYTIAAIGLESGFNSKSSFYSAFKKFTGKTPIDYKKHVRNS